jgi:small subunit ribosomal protein S5
MLVASKHLLTLHAKKDWSFSMADQPAAPAAAAHATPQSQRGGGRGGNQRGGRRDDRRNAAPEAPKEFEEVVINIDRVARVVKGGRRFRFKALVVVGDRKNKVGIGVAKGGDVQSAIAKATDVAKKHLIHVPVTNTTIPHEAETKLSGAHVLIKPAAPGTGIIAGGVVRSIMNVTGIRNLISKSLGSTNKVNIAYATVEAFRTLVPRDQWLNADKKAKKPVEKKSTEVGPVTKADASAAKPVAKKAVAKKPAAKKETK